MEWPTCRPTIFLLQSHVARAACLWHLPRPHHQAVNLLLLHLVTPLLCHAWMSPHHGKHPCGRRGGQPRLRGMRSVPLSPASGSSRDWRCVPRDQSSSTITISVPNLTLIVLPLRQLHSGAVRAVLAIPRCLCKGRLLLQPPQLLHRRLRLFVANLPPNLSLRSGLASSERSGSGAASIHCGLCHADTTAS